MNPFEVLTSSDGVIFDTSFLGENTIPTPLGVGESFDFPSGAEGQWVRILADLDPAEDQWMSLNEVGRRGKNRRIVTLTVVRSARCRAWHCTLLRWLLSGEIAARIKAAVRGKQRRTQ